MPTIPPSITTLPAAPDPNNRTTFNALAYPWSAALPTFGTQVSAVGANVKANADEAHADAVATAADRVQTGLDKVATAADRVQTAADRVQTGLDRASATSSASTASTKAGEANASAIAAAASAASISGGPVTSVNGQTGVVTGLQSALVSGTSIKTINSTSILGSGNVVTGDVTLAGVQTLTKKTIDIADNTLTGVQPTLVSGTNIKTINGASALGAGNLEVGGGSLVFLSQVTASSSATVDVETTFDSTYDEYIIKITNLYVSNDAVNFYIRMKIGGGYLSSATYRSTADATNIQTENRLFASNELRNDRPINAVVNIHKPASTSDQKTFTLFGVCRAGSEANILSLGGWNTTTGSAMTGMRFFASSGNILSGTFRLYGIKKA